MASGHCTPGRRQGAAAALAASLALTVACAGLWDPKPLEARYPALARAGPHRLADATPYVLPSQGVLTLFLCRWPTDRAIPVSLPPDATPAETKLLEDGLRAWEGAGLGVHFAPGAPPRQGIEIRFRRKTGAPYSATTIADCALDPARLEPSASGVLPAKLVFASIHLRRTNRDVLGRPVELSEEELVGSLLHELGHALGFQGHVLRGDSVMVREVDQVRAVGRRFLAGRGFRDPSLRALYAVRSGAVVRRAPLSRQQTAPFDRMVVAAGERGLRGPRVRVGDREAWLGWRDAAGRGYALLIPRIREVLRSPAKLAVEPAPRAAELLAER